MVFDDPLPPEDDTFREIKVAVLTAVATTLATRLVEWGVDELRKRFRSKDKPRERRETS